MKLRFHSPFGKLFGRARNAALSLSIAIPLQTADLWNHIKFNGLKQNEVSFSAEGIKMKVAKSASPLVFFLGEPTLVRGFELAGEIAGFPNLPAGSDEWDRRAGDYALRLGFAEEASEAPNFFERLFAPGWVRELIRLRPERKFGKLRFYDVSQVKEVGASREHPGTKWVNETVALQTSTPGSFQLAYTFPEPFRLFGVWIQADGDDTASEFQTTVHSLKLLTETPKM